MSESQFNCLFTLKNAHLSSNSYNFWTQPNTTMKFTGYVAWILLYKCSKFGEKITTVLEISNFSQGLTFFWRALYIFIQIFVVGSERCTYFEIQCVVALQGHPRSLILTPIESAYATFYWPSIVTLVLSCPVSEKLQVSEKSYPTPIPPEF